jgi:hypothetical protein
MANLRANRITSTEVFETTGSVQFDGSGDYLSLASSTDFDFGTGDFTIEWFQYWNSLSSYQTLYDSNYATSPNLIIQTGNGNGKYIVYLNGTSIQITETIAAVTGRWYHYAIVRSGDTVTIYRDGIINGSGIYGSTVGNSTVTVYIGGSTGGGGYYINGHISNFRILKGTALYTENFTPPTRELEVIPNTVLLACQSTTKADEEKTGKTITVTGNAVANELTPGLLTSVVKSGGSSAITGSVEFDGTGDYLSNTSSDYAFGTGDYTFECWFYLTSGNQYNQIFDLGVDSGPTVSCLTNISGSTFTIDTYDGSSHISASYSINQWHHLAVVRNSGTIRVYMNGVLDTGTNSWANSTNFTGSLQFTIGVNSNLSSYSYKGFISNLRIIKGTALYTSNFIPPTRKLTNLPGTVLLCCQDNESVTTEVTGKTITANGDPTASDFTPSVGSDGSVEFAGPTTINTENYFYLPTGPTEQRDSGAGVRGVIMGGYTTPENSIIDYINIATTGNAITFGTLTTAESAGRKASSTTRGLCAGSNGIQYITIPSAGDSQDFGTLNAPGNSSDSGCSSSTRGIFAGGLSTGPTTWHNNIDYVTISTTGDAVDFGDLSEPKNQMAGLSSPTRGIFAGGYSPTVNTINYITISSTGDAQDFGDLINVRFRNAGCSSSVRGVIGGGQNPGYTNSIEYITIASTGNSQDFGDLSQVREFLNATSSQIRGIFSGGSPGSTYDGVNTIDYVTIAITSTATDFGDLTVARGRSAVVSNGHGGLG